MSDLIRNHTDRFSRIVAHFSKPAVVSDLLLQVKFSQSVGCMLT